MIAVSFFRMPLLRRAFWMSVHDVKSVPEINGKQAEGRYELSMLLKSDPQSINVFVTGAITFATIANTKVALQFLPSERVSFFGIV